MVRSLWKRTLVASLAWAGMAVAQQPATDASRLASAAKPAVSAERVVTVQEQGKPGQRCKLIRSWKTADGAKAYQVRALDTGEMITVVESGPVTTTSGARPGTRMQAVATRIFHWGKSPAPPAGAPLPPAELVQTSAQAAAQPHATPSWAQTTPGTTTRSDGIVPRLFSKAHGQEAPATASNCDPCDPCQSKQTAQACPPCQPSMPVRSVQMSQPYESQPSRMAQSSQPSRVTQAVQPGASSSASPYSPVPNGNTRSTATSLPLPGAASQASRSASASPYTPMPTAVVRVPAATQVRLYDSSPPAMPALKVADMTPAAAQTTPCDPCAPAMPPMKVAGTTPAPSPMRADVTLGSNDWRKSWGKADDHMSVTPAQPTPQASANKPATSAMPVVVAQSKKPDPLESPEMLTVDKPARSSRKLLGWPKSAAERSEKAVVSSSEVTTTTAPGKEMPAGSGSVISAGEGAPGSVHYVPVPIVTMPDLQRPPMPPLPRLPQPPAPFAQPGTGNNMPTSRAPGPNPTTTDEGMVNAFTSLPSKEQVANATNAFGSMEPPAPGYAGQPMMAQGYAMMGQGMPGPMVNSPMGQGMITAGYLPPPQGYDMMAAAGEQQMLYGLKDSLYPSQREWAVEGLATFDWHAHPEIVQALVLAAQGDPAPTVRAACVRSLARMNVNSLPVVEMVRQMRNDVDPRVRQEADQALAALGAATPAAMRTAVQPVGSWTSQRR